MDSIMKSSSFRFHRHDSPLFDFIESCLRNKHELVIYEAASAIVNMPNCTARELAPAVSGKLDYLSTSVTRHLAFF